MGKNNYPGHKGMQHVYKTIINNIPKHSIYMELFAGSAQIAIQLQYNCNTLIAWPVQLF